VADHYIQIDKATVLEYLPEEANAPTRTRDEVEALLKPELPVAAPAQSSRSDATPQQEAVEKQLASGATLLLRQRTDLPIVALHVLFPGGRRLETRLTCGITNLMLKSCLKGTRRLSAEEIANRIEGLGSGIGLTNSPDYFGYSLKILRPHLEEGMNILREVICEPTFDADEVEKEKQSIYGEIRRQLDSMSGRAIDLCNAAIFGDGPYGLPGAGLAEAVEKVTPNDLRAWHEASICGEGAVIATVGDISAEEMTDLVSGLIPSSSQACGTPPQQEVLPPGERAVEIDRQQTAAVMAFPGVTIYDEDRHALDLLAEITSGQAGRFFQAVRGDNALAYAVSSFHRARRDAGSFVTYTATSPSKEEEARRIILAECERLTREPVGAKELQDAKEAIIGEQAIGLQSFGAQAGELGVNRLLGKPIDTPQIYLARIRSLTAEDVLRAATTYLDPERCWRGVVRGKESGRAD
jgi:zinc protease